MNKFDFFSLLKIVGEKKVCITLLELFFTLKIGLTCSNSPADAAWIIIEFSIFWLCIFLNSFFCSKKWDLIFLLKGIDNKISGDLLAIDIRQALQHLGELTGEVTNDDILIINKSLSLDLSILKEKWLNKLGQISN